MAIKNYDSTRDDYKTPVSIYQQILDFVGAKRFYLDVCCSDRNIPAFHYYTKNGMFHNSTDNGLLHEWDGLCFMNPPFKTCPKWVKKAVESVEKNSCEVWAVLPTNRCEALYYQDNIFNSNHCVFGFLPLKQGFIIPGQEHIPPIPSQGIMIACFSKRASEIQYGWNSDKLFNTKAFLGGVE